jgi:hypothetical protein
MRYVPLSSKRAGQQLHACDAASITPSQLQSWGGVLKMIEKADVYYKKTL